MTILTPYIAHCYHCIIIGAYYPISIKYKHIHISLVITYIRNKHLVNYCLNRTISNYTITNIKTIQILQQKSKNSNSNYYRLTDILIFSLQVILTPYFCPIVDIDNTTNVPFPYTTLTYITTQTHQHTKQH